MKRKILDHAPQLPVSLSECNPKMEPGVGMEKNVRFPSVGLD